MLSHSVHQVVTSVICACTSKMQASIKIDLNFVVGVARLKIYVGLQTPRLPSYSILNLYGPAVTLYTTRFNVQKFYVRATKYIFAFCMDLRINTDYVPIQN